MNWMLGVWYSTAMNDDDRISVGEPVATPCTPLPNRGAPPWLRSTKRIRENTLALELARLDELQETFYAHALEGVSSVAPWSPRS
jgi:hypothetical protein